MAAFRYATNGNITIAADTALTVIGSATIHFGIYYLSAGATASAADAALLWSVRHFTADGTEGAAVTPVALNGNDPAAQAGSGETYSAEPTYAGANLLEWGMNARSVYQWYAQEGGELVNQRAAGDGIGCIYDAESADAGNQVVTMHFYE